MSLTAGQITIAVTVFDRREYVRAAVASALAQTVPVRVIVVEDCGPDAGMREFVLQEFGDRITYHRNAQRRGLFGNWNECLALCPTPWLSILHDDDLLEPGFVAAMLELAKQFPDCALYFGETGLMNEAGAAVEPDSRQRRCQQPGRVTLEDALYQTPFWFPGQLMQVAAVRAEGGFRETSQFCGDWEMWSKLMVHGGAAETPQPVARFRQHAAEGRATSRVLATGRWQPLMNVQRKRIQALRRRCGDTGRFDRLASLRHSPVPLEYLRDNGSRFSERLLRYHVGLLRAEPAFNWKHRVFQWAAAVGGVPLVRRWCQWMEQRTPEGRP